MLDRIKNRKQEGFTIIEVLIVLAIAGLIMLIVFLAVPALQRSSRNRGREADASLIASAISECVTNNNGKIANCQDLGADKVSYDDTKMSQLTTDPTYTDADGLKDKATWQFGRKCDGSTVDSGADREFVVRFKIEGANDDQPRCISS